MEGPSLIIIREQVKIFRGKKIISAHGNAKIDMQRMEGKSISRIKTWGKHFLLCFPGFFVRIHFLMFGSYRINEEKNNAPRLSLKFRDGMLNFYTCAITLWEGNPDDVYDWEVDVMSDQWNDKTALTHLRQLKKEMVCDVLLNQSVFSGVGNIIKNEVLFRIRIHPETKIQNLTLAKRKELISEARNYSFDFLKWKRIFQLKKHWLIYHKKTCPRCNLPVHFKITGKGKRASFFCTNCQLKPAKKVLQ